MDFLRMSSSLDVVDVKQNRVERIWIEFFFFLCVTPAAFLGAEKNYVK